MTRSPCSICKYLNTPKNEMPCAACPDPAEYAESLGHASLPTRTIKEMVKVQPYKPAPKEPESMSNILNKVFKPCPGPLHNGESLPLNKFSKPTASVDGRSKLCIECQKKELADMPKKEKKTRGCPPGGWPKKEKPNIADWMEGKIDHPSKPCAEIQKDTPAPMPESRPTQNSPLKFDLSKFKKIEIETRITEVPTVRIGTRDVSFNTAASRDFGLMKFTGLDVYVGPLRGNKKQIVFILRSDAGATFKLHQTKGYCMFTNRTLLDKINVKTGKYPVQMVDGALIAEVENNV